jgi:hypothetical protein
MDITLATFWKITAAIVLLATVLGSIAEWISPASDPIIVTGAAICALATWATPPLGFALHAWQDRGRIQRPPSLVSAGRTIGIVLHAAFFSLVGSALGLVSVMFGQSRWAWLTLLAILAFWVLGALWGSLASRHRAERP